MKNYKTDKKLLLAPFQGITDKVYRGTFAKHFKGFEEMYTPFISGTGTTSINPSKLKDLLPFEVRITSTVPQIISTKPSEIKLFAKSLAIHGYKHINWNLGCPFSRIANKKRGCGILPYPEDLKIILDDIFADLLIKLSVKTRLGHHNPDEIYRVIEVLNDYPLKHVILHPRTGVQIYRGEADHQAFIQCLAYSKHNLVYNGDIFNLSKFRMLAKLMPNQKTWMIGRGALMNPFLPSEIMGLFFSDEEKRATLYSFHNELFSEIQTKIKSQPKLLGRMKAIWYYMSGIFADGNKVFQKIKLSKNVNEYSKALDFAFSQELSDETQQADYFNNSLKHIGSLTSE